jgi:hypothetical protein
MEKAHEIKRRIASEMSESDATLFMRAFDYAAGAHGKQLRKSGDLYIYHPIAVSEKLWNIYHDTELTIAGLLHDTTEDCDVSISEIYDTFGHSVGFMVDAVDKNRKTFHNSDISIEDKIERLLYAGLQDVRVLLLKIADREHNIDTLQHLPGNKQVRMAFETQAVYKPLKHVLHLYDDNLSIDGVRKHFEKCMKEKNVTTPQEIKGCLYRMSFKEFSDEMFDLVYNNSHKIVWEIEDQEYLNELSQNKDFEEHAHIDNMWTDGKSFKAAFTFDKGYIMNANVGLKVSSYKQK